MNISEVKSSNFYFQIQQEPTYLDCIGSMFKNLFQPSILKKTTTKWDCMSPQIKRAVRETAELSNTLFNRIDLYSQDLIKTNFFLSLLGYGHNSTLKELEKFNLNRANTIAMLQNAQTVPYDKTIAKEEIPGSQLLHKMMNTLENGVILLTDIPLNPPEKYTEEKLSAKDQLKSLESKINYLKYQVKKGKSTPSEIIESYNVCVQDLRKLISTRMIKPEIEKTLKLGKALEDLCNEIRLLKFPR
jgi:hypothetical protein